MTHTVDFDLIDANKGQNNSTDKWTWLFNLWTLFFYILSDIHSLQVQVLMSF